MSIARFFAPENRLGKVIAVPGGKKIETAIADAEAQIMLVADESVGKIDELLETVYQTTAESANAHLGQIYQPVREVAGLAGVAGLPDLGVAAHIFCSLIDLAQRKGVLSDDQIQVNLGVMRLLRRPDRFSPDERQALLDNLRAVLDKAEQHAAA